MTRQTLFRIAFLGLVLVSAGAVQGAGDPVYIPTSLVVDPCRYHSSAEGTVTSEVALMDLPLPGTLEENAWATTSDGHYRGAAWATMPGFETRYVFMSRGRYLEVYDLDTPVTIPGAPEITDAVATIDIAALAGIPGFEIGRIAAGSYKPVEVQPGAVVGAAALYLIGTAGTTGSFVVLDQEHLITGQGPSPTVLYGSGDICTYSSCVTLDSVDLAVGDLADTNYSEEALITAVQDFYGTELAVTYRLERSLNGFGFTLTQSFAYLWSTPQVPQASGLAFADSSHDAYASLKPNLIRNIQDASLSCELMGEPTDISIWEPGIASNHSRYLLVTSHGDDGKGRVEIIPAGDCTTAGPTVHFLKTDAQPTSVGLHVIDNNEAMLIVASQGDHISEGHVESIRVKLQVVNGQDVFSEVNRQDYDMSLPQDPPASAWFSETCPSEVAIGVRLALPDQNPKGLDQNCLPSDPRCPAP